MIDQEMKRQDMLTMAVDRKMVFGTSFCISCNDELWCGASGDMAVGSQYFIASTTKLFVTALILISVSRGSLSLDDQIGGLLADTILHGLYKWNGQDHSPKITLRQLLVHTSGLHDYFQGEGQDGASLENSITHDRD